MGEKRYFLIFWDNGKAHIVGQPCNDKGLVMKEYEALKDKTFYEVCETIYG